MANKDLKLKPHNLRDQNAWWYEEPHGLTVCSEFSIHGTYKKVQIVKISWKALRGALARKDKQ